MTATLPADPARPVTSVEELVAHFQLGCKAADRLHVGMEHEKIAVLADGSAPGFEVISALLGRLIARGYGPLMEAGNVIAVERPGHGSVTLEPGGQVEFSGAPFASAALAVQENDLHLAELIPEAAQLGVAFLGVGFRPFGSLEDVPWMPRGRYRVMRTYLATRGARGHDMMKRTATVQANLDYVDEADAMEKLRLGLGLSPLVVALFAASPLTDGRPNGFQSYRAWCWLDTDPERCGLLPFAFRPGASFRDYAEWALDVPMFFIHRVGEYRPVSLTFRRFMREGWQGERATTADWETHLSTLFPETRLKRYVEVRQADASTREMARALPTLWRGLLYDRTSREAAWALVSSLSVDERLALAREVPQRGLEATLNGRPLHALGGDLVEIAAAGLARLAAETRAHAGTEDGLALLDPLREVARERRTVADRILAAHAAAGGDRGKLIEALRLR